MHKLDRSRATIPECLGRYRHGHNNWSDLNHEDRTEIRTSLQEMQCHRCAYCECDLDQHGQHIEHYRQRGRCVQSTFEWDNLFWSCERTDSCGKHKDGCGAYNHEDLIKPDVEDPEYFFLFVSNGSIALRSSLTTIELHRAKETLRVFNLDAQWGPLRKMRKTAVSGYLETLKELEEMSTVCSQEEIEAYISSEFAYIMNLPFCTAIKHILSFQGPTP